MKGMVLIESGLMKELLAHIF